MRVLITGGAGYLGSVLASLLLRQGTSVRVLDNLTYGGRSLLGLVGDDGFEFIGGDVRDGGCISAALENADAVVHLAAIVGDPACATRPDLAIDVNLNASLELIRCLRQTGVRRVVFASTCSNYGRVADMEFATEEQQLNPLSLYAETKVAVEEYLMREPQATCAATVLRFATLYGISPRMRFDLTVNEFVMRMYVQRKLEVYGGEFWRPYVHVRDAARAIAMVLAAPLDLVQGRVFNVGNTEENYRKRDLVELIKRRVSGAEVNFVVKAEDPRDYRVSFDRIRSVLGFASSRTVWNGIDEILCAIKSGILEDVTRRGDHKTASASQFGVAR